MTVTSAGVASAPGSALFFTFEPAAPAPVTPALPTPPNGTAPFVSSVAPVSGSVNGGVVITLLGFNLGNDAIDCAAVQVGPLACSSISWSSPTMVLCSTPPAPTSGPAAVSARTRSGGPGPAGPSYTYAPHVIGVFPRDLQYAGGDVITVIGRGFGLANAAPPAEVAIQGVACSTTAFSSESMLVCTTPSFAKVGSPAPSLTVSMPAVSASTTLSPAQARLTYRLASAWNFCSPPCGFPGDCDGAAIPRCICQRGYAGPPGCALQLLSIAVARPLVVEGESGEGGTVEVLRGGAEPVPGSTITVAAVGISSPRVVWGGGGAAGTGPVGPAGSPASIRLAAAADDIRSAPLPFTVTVTTSSADPLFDGIILGPVVLSLNDSAPTIRSVTPKAVPLAGGITLTVRGDHFDQVTHVTIDGLPCNVTGMLTRTTNRTLAQRVSLQSPSAAADPSLEEVTVLEVTTPPVRQGRANAYAVLTITNALSSTATSSATSVFYTELCPKQGQLGTGINCRDCPRGAECPGGERVWPRPGFWAPSEDAGHVVQCSPPESCRGYDPAGKDFAKQCTPGYEGERCGKCARSYYRSADLCVACPASGSRAAYIFADVLVWCSFGFVGTFLRNRIGLSYIFLAVKSLQSIAGVGSMASNNMPRWIVQTYEFLHLFSGDYSFVKAECGKALPYTVTYFAGLAYTVALTTPLLLLITVMAAVTSDATKKIFFLDRRTRCVQIALIFWYLPMTTSSLATLSCVPNSDGSQFFMTTHPNERCYVSEKTAAMAVSILVIIGLTVLFPILTMVHLRRMARAGRERLVEDDRIRARWDIYYEFMNARSPYFWIVDYPILVIVALGKSALRPHIITRCRSPSWCSPSRCCTSA